MEKPTTDTTPDGGAIKPYYDLAGSARVSLYCEIAWIFLCTTVLLALGFMGMGDTWLDTIATVVFFPLSMWLLPTLHLNRHGLLRRRFLGLDGRIQPRDIGLAALIALTLYFLLQLPEELWASFLDSADNQNVIEDPGFIRAEDGSSLLLQVVVSCAFPAYFEEYLYRGFLYRSLRGAMGFGRAAMFSTAIFTLMHADLYNLVVPIAIGLACAFTMEYTGSIKPGMVIHFFYNFFVTVVGMGFLDFLPGQYFAVGYGQVWQKHFVFGIPILFLLALGVLYVLLRKVRRRGRYENSVSIREYADCMRSPNDMRFYWVTAGLLLFWMVLQYT